MARTLLRSPNDGHDFFFGDIGSLGLNPLYFKKLPYSPGRDLVSVVDIFHAPLVVYVSKDSPYKTVGELIAAARKSPGKLTFATPGAGGPMWIGAEQLGVRAGTKLLHVPFKEMGPLLTAVATGEVDMMVTSAATARPVLDRLRPLAVTDSGRLAELPAIPTVQEAMNLDVQVVAWAMLVAARGTPRRIVEKVRADALTAMKKPEFSGKTKLFGLNPSKEMTVDQLDAFIVSESEKYAPAVKASGVFYGTGYEVHGFDNVRAFYEERMRTFQGQGFYADDFLVNDDVMVARGWFKGSPRGFFFGAQASGKPMLFRLTLWVDFDADGLVRGESAYFDGKEFARQAEHGYELLADGDQKP
ncbi:hypothetical protein OSTOST_01346 [Ostertagia ostertagi]